MGYSSDEVERQVAEARREGWVRIHLRGASGEDLKNAFDEYAKFRTSTQSHPLESLIIRGCYLLDSDSLKAIKEHLGQLKFLNIRNCSYLKPDSLKAIKDYLGQLDGLDISGCDSIDSDSLKAIKDHLGRLHNLDISGCYSLDSDSLKAIKDSLGRLTSLSMIDCTKLDSDSLRAIKDSVGLRFLNISGCSNIPADVLLDLLEPPCTLPNVFINGCTGLGLPESALFESDPARVRELLLAQTASKKQTWLEVKVVVLGEGRVGKTDLVTRLRTGGQHLGNGKTTHDFEIHPIEMMVERDLKQQKVTCNFFDFGGQPELHSTHRFFLESSRVVYLLVLDGRYPYDSENCRAEYWLRMIKRQGKESPVVIVFTHGDSDRRQTNLAVGYIAKQLGINVIGVINGYANLTPEGHEKLKLNDLLPEVEAALSQAIASMDYIFQPAYSDGFFALKRFVAGQARQDEFPEVELHGPEYKHFPDKNFKAAAAHIARSEASMGDFADIWFKELRAAGYFLYVGDKLHQGDNPHGIRDLCFNPLWIKSPAYCVIRNTIYLDDTSRSPGMVKHDELLEYLQNRRTEMINNAGEKHELWCGMPFEEADAERVIELLKACELIFQMDRDGGREYLVPDLLPRRRESPDDYQADETWALEFEFLPESVLHRFVGRWYARVCDGHVYKNQVKVRHELCGESRALIHADVLKRQIVVRLRGLGEGRQRLGHSIVTELSEIEPIVKEHQIRPHSPPAAIYVRNDKELEREFGTPAGVLISFLPKTNPVGQEEQWVLEFQKGLNTAPKVLIKALLGLASKKPGTTRNNMEQIAGLLRIEIDPPNGTKKSDKYLAKFPYYTDQSLNAKTLSPHSTAIAAKAEAIADAAQRQCVIAFLHNIKLPSRRVRKKNLQRREE